MIVTLQSFWDDILSQCDQENFACVSQAQLTTWINCGIEALWAECVIANPNACMKFGGVAITSGNSISVIAAGLTDFAGPRGVDIDLGGGQFARMPTFNFQQRSNVCELSYQFFDDTLMVLPASRANVYPYRVWYIPRPAVLDASIPAGTVSLPPSGQDYVVQDVAAKVRVRLEEDPRPHYEGKKEALQIVQRYMRSLRGNQTIAEVDGVGF